MVIIQLIKPENSVDEKFYIKVISPNFNLEYGLNSNKSKKD